MENLKIEENQGRRSIHQSFLARIPLSSLIIDKAPVKLLEPSTSVSEFLNLTKKSNLSTYPISSSENDDTFFMLSKFDVITALSFSTNPKKLSNLTCGEIAKSSHFALNCVCIIYDANKTLNTAIEPFSKGVRSILVQMQDKLYLVTQVDVLRFLLTASPSLSAMLDGKISKLGLATEEDKMRVEIVKETLTFTEAFKRTFQKEIDTVLIVDKINKKLLKGSIGNNDLAKVDSGMYEQLKNMNVLEASHKMHAKCLKCTPNDTLFHIMELFEKHNKSEVVVEEDGKIYSIVGFNELLCKFSFVDHKSTATTERLSMLHRFSK
eukprot:GAHX01001185.1.p1 GENE.GAHX01001185.1~~GAHX01001185.1.p1  ORF type:complete len:322 (+),score=65.91 GAHX01001185.1:778-1743(+)